MTSLRYLAGAMALCILCSAPAAASCIARKNFTAFVAERFPQARMAVLGDSRMLLAAVNRVSRTPLAADEIVIVDVAGMAPAVPVALFEGGCMSRLGHLPRPMISTILNSVAREGA